MTVTDGLPRFLKLWIVLHLVSFVVAPFMNTGPFRSWVSYAIGALVVAAIGFGMWRHAKGAWVGAVLLAGWTILGGLPALRVALDGLDAFDGVRDLLWYLSGFVFGGLGLAVLLSGEALDWVNRPTERAWTPARSDLSDR